MQSNIKIIDARGKSSKINFRELKEYRYLIALFIKRDMFTIYKQTVLGPLWFILQPILTTLVYTVVFGFIAKLPTNGYPAFLFFFSGIICWNAFAVVMNRISNSFLENTGVFSKVYFPRLTAPIAATIASFSITLVQLAVLILVAVYYMISGFHVSITFLTVVSPLLLVLASLLGLGFGLLVAAGTIKYRDLINFLSFAMLLWMYATPVIYATDLIPERFRMLLFLNPLSGVVVNFKYFLFGIGEANIGALLYSIVFAAAVLFAGVHCYQKAQKNFVDTI